MNKVIGILFFVLAFCRVASASTNETTKTVSETSTNLVQVLELVESSFLVDTDPKMTKIDNRVCSVTEIDINAVWEATKKDQPLRLKEGFFLKKAGEWRFTPIWTEKKGVITFISISPDTMNYLIVKRSR